MEVAGHYKLTSIRSTSTCNNLLSFGYHSVLFEGKLFVIVLLYCWLLIKKILLLVVRSCLC